VCGGESTQEILIRKKQFLIINEMTEHLLSKCEASCSNPSTTKKTKQKHNKPLLSGVVTSDKFRKANYLSEGDIRE
jgi:hypothetical protein